MGFILNVSSQVVQNDAQQNNPKPPTSIIGPQVVCINSSELYSCNPPPGVVAHWSVQSGIIIGSSVGNTVLVAFNPKANIKSNPYSISLYYEQDGCISSSISIAVTVHKPILKVTKSDPSVCGSTYGTYAVADVDADSYEWTIIPHYAGNIESGQNSNAIHVLWNQTPRDAFISLKVKKCNIDYVLASPIKVTITNPPTVIISGPSKICSKIPATFSLTTAPAGSATSILWNFGDGASSNASTPSYQYHTPIYDKVEYTVTATVSGANGCPMDALAAVPVTIVKHGSFEDIGCSVKIENNRTTAPFQPNLTHEIRCGKEDNYQVTLLDYSTYYDDSSKSSCFFSVDGGKNWIAGTPNEKGVQQYTTLLKPGNHKVGIKISSPDILPFEKYTTITLSEKPCADFTSDAYPNPVCEGNPVHFTPSYPKPNYHYLWDFTSGEANLQSNPVKVYKWGLNPVALTVSDQYGCISHTATNVVLTKIQTKQKGRLMISPMLACQGSKQDIDYVVEIGTPNSIQTYFWYKNKDVKPYAVTTEPHLTVNEPGIYKVVLKTNNGCMQYDTDSVTTTFVPVPNPPIICGNTIAFVTSAITLNVPSDNYIGYEWYRNGKLQPQWNNLTTITDYPSKIGIYNYSVVAKVQFNKITYCASESGTISVNVINLEEKK